MNINVIDNENLKINGNKLTVTDKNGATFDISINDVIDVSTFSQTDICDISDSEKKALMNFKPTIKDSNNNTIEDTELLDIVRSGEVIALDVLFEATHSGDNLNNAVYTSESLAKDTSSWMFPFPKPLIKNHNLTEEPIGRARNSYFGKSEIVLDRDAVNVLYRVTDSDAMMKFADGRYKTMSIGATTKYVKCNICGKEILKDDKFDFCGHWKGNTYAGKKATWTTEDMTFVEGSIVNTPADLYAQVKNITVITKNNKDNQSDDNKAVDDIDNILNNSSSKNVHSNITDNNNTIDNVEPVNDNEDNENQQHKIKDYEDNIVKLKDDINSLTNEKDSLLKTLEEKDNKISVYESNSEAFKSEIKNNNEQLKRLAKFNVDILKDLLIALDTNIKKEDLEDKSAKDLMSIITNKKEQNINRDSSVQVTNPGLAAVDDKNSLKDNEDSNEQKQESTMKDMHNVVSGIFNSSENNIHTEE